MKIFLSIFFLVFLYFTPTYSNDYYLKGKTPTDFMKSGYRSKKQSGNENSFNAKKYFIDSDYTIYDRPTPLELRGVGCLASS